MIARHSVLRFVLSRVAASLGDQVLVFAVPLIVYRSTGSVQMSGLALFLEWVPRIVSLPIAGNAADRLGAWRVYLYADGLRALACVVALIVTHAVPQQIFPIVVALVATTAFFFSQGTISTEVSVARLVSVANLPRAQSVLQTIDQASMICGPALAAIAVIWLRPLYLLVGIAMCFSLSALVIVTLRPELDTSHASDERTRKAAMAGDVWSSARLLFTTPALRMVTAQSMMVNLIVGIALATGAATTVGRFGLPNSYYGILQVAIGAFALATFALIPALTRRYSVFTLGFASYGLIVIGGLLMAAGSTFVTFVIGFGLASGLCGLFNVYIRTERVQWIAREQLGTVIGVIVFFNQLSVPAAGLLVAIAPDHASIQEVLLIAVIVATALFIVSFIVLLPIAKTARLHVTSIKARV